MSFVSYAQNFEDVMLWRALKHVENGFYIDVGANDPSDDSVTRAFYKQGWHGINIEPLLSHYADLVRERPRDTNLQCACGASNGEIEIWECDVRGWGTASAAVVAQHEANGHEGVFHKVPVLPLSEICADNVSSEVHFLKIDVEGFEKSVIEGMDFSRCRPWILVVEATRPNSTAEVHADWEGIVQSSEYVFAYSDGLNRFYVAKEHSELMPALRYPPNVLDGFIRAGEFYAALGAQQAEAKAQQAEAKAQQAEAKAQQAETASNERLAQLQAVYSSTSWKVTKPLRAIKRLLAGDFATLGRSTAAVTLKAKQTFRPVLSSSIKYVFKKPVLRKTIDAALKYFPGLRQRLVNVAVNTRVVGGNSHAQRALPLEFHAMTPRARQIYHDLKAAFESKNKGGA